MRDEIYNLARKEGHDAYHKASGVTHYGIKDNPYCGDREKLWQCIAWSNGWVAAERRTK